ncbi:hypothetical protein V8E53_014465, partial [Lactarius tabidus]
MPGGARITFTPLTQLFSPFEPPPNAYPVHNDIHASFCTVFSLDSSKFTVASQEGASKTMGTASRWDWAMLHTGRLDGVCGMCITGLSSHTSLLHVIDTTMFKHEEIICEAIVPIRVNQIKLSLQPYQTKAATLRIRYDDGLAAPNLDRYTYFFDDFHLPSHVYLNVSWRRLLL